MLLTRTKAVTFKKIDHQVCGHVATCVHLLPSLFCIWCMHSDCIVLIAYQIVDEDLLANMEALLGAPLEPVRPARRTTCVHPCNSLAVFMFWLMLGHGPYLRMSQLELLVANWNHILMNPTPCLSFLMRLCICPRWAG